MPRQHRRNPVANPHPWPLPTSWMKTLMLLAQRTWTNAINPEIKKRIRLKNKARKIPMPIPVLQFIRFDMLVPGRFSIPTLRQRRIRKRNIRPLFQRLVQRQNRLPMLAIIHHRRQRQQHRPRVSFTLLPHQLATLLREQPFPALQQILHSPRVRRTRREPLLQSHKSPRLIFTDVYIKERLRQPKRTRAPLISNSEPPQAPLIRAPLHQVRRIRFRQIINQSIGERFYIAMETPLSRTLAIKRQTINYFLSRQTSWPGNLQEYRQQHRAQRLIPARIDNRPIPGTRRRHIHVRLVSLHSNFPLYRLSDHP